MEEIIITETPTYEGEQEEQDMHEVTENNKQKAETEDKLRKTKGVRPDYRCLNNPKPEDEVSEEREEIFAAEIGNEFHSLKEAKASPDWPEWKDVITAKLDQYREKGTWELVDKPADTIPLTNKWVFVKKRDKQGNIIKNKARLVVSGYGQHLGYDYLETHLSIVQMESIRAILAIAVAKQLKIQQMDVKGAYLNGILKETIYMCQPNGFEDGTKRICYLIRTLYGLEQSGHKWNTEFNRKMKK